MFSIDELTTMMEDDQPSHSNEAAGAAGSWDPSILAPSPPQPAPPASPPTDQRYLNRPTDIHDLPNEILHHILKFVDKGNLYAAASVNRKWHDSAKRAHRLRGAAGDQPVFQTSLETAFQSADGTRWALETGYKPNSRSLYVAAKMGVDDAVLVLLDYLVSQGQPTILPAAAKVFGERGLFSTIKRIYALKLKIGRYATAAMFTGACMSGHTHIAEYILDNSIVLFDSWAPIRTMAGEALRDPPNTLAFTGLEYLSKGGHFETLLRVVEKYRLRVSIPILEDAARLADIDTLKRITVNYSTPRTARMPFSAIFAATKPENVNHIMQYSFIMRSFEEYNDAAIRALKEGRRDILPFICRKYREAYEDLQIQACFEYVNRTGDLEFIKFAISHSYQRDEDPRGPIIVGGPSTMEICLYLQDEIGFMPARGSQHDAYRALMALNQERCHPTGNKFVASFECVKWYCMPMDQWSEDIDHYIPSLREEEIRWLDEHFGVPINIRISWVMNRLVPSCLTSSERFNTIRYIVQRDNIDLNSIEYTQDILSFLDTPELIKLDALGLEARRASLGDIIRAKKYDFMRYALERGCTCLEPNRTDDIPSTKVSNYFGEAAENMDAFKVLHETFIAHLQPQNDNQRTRLTRLKARIFAEAAKCGLQTLQKLYELGYSWEIPGGNVFNGSHFTYDEVKWMMTLGYRPDSLLLRAVLEEGSVQFYKLIHYAHLVLPYRSQYSIAINNKNWAVAEYIESSLLSPEERASLETPYSLRRLNIDRPPKVVW